MTDPHGKLKVGHWAREKMQYNAAISIYSEVIYDTDAPTELIRQALHMRGVSYRCVGNFEEALRDLGAARELATELDDTVRIERDMAMVYIDRWQLPVDRSRALALVGSAFITLGEMIDDPRENEVEGRRDWLMAERAITRGFLARAQLRDGDYRAAVINLRLARGELKRRQRHYLVNNQVWLVRALSQSPGFWRRHVLSRVHAAVGAFEAIFARQDGRRAGSNLRVKEFLVLLLGGEELYQRAKKRFLK